MMVDFNKIMSDTDGGIKKVKGGNDGEVVKKKVELKK